MPYLKDAPVGAMVQLDGVPELGTVLVKLPNGYNIMVGWKDKPDGIGWPMDAHVRHNYNIPEGDYKWGWWFVPIHPAKIISIAAQTSSVVAGGMQCSGKYCSEFNPWAQPNTPTGKYLCFSCRQRHPSMR